MRIKKSRKLLVVDLLLETREELSRADNKIAVILAAVGIISGAIVASILSGEWTPYDLPLWLALFWWLGSAAFIFAIFVLGFALYPRVHLVSHKPDFVSYFRDVKMLSDDGALSIALDRTAKAPEKRDVDQLIQISSIVVRKYQLLRVALWTLAVGLFCLLLVAIGGGVYLSVVP